MDKVEELLTRGVDTIYPTKQDLAKVLKSGKKLTLYQGFDPTGTQLHLGHMVGFRKLRQWQDLGHHVIFLIGDGTGQAGDPSGKTKARDKFFTQEELRKNATDYVKQAASIVKFDGENPIEIRYNGDWLNKLNLIEILTIAGHFSLQQLSERDLFQERIKKGEDVNLREFLYPLLQGYDSVAMNVDLELGGSDQTFNMLAGRKLVREILNKEKFVMTTPLLTDSLGRKIGKTEGNVIALTDKPEELVRKITDLPDDIIMKAFEYLTDISMSEINKMESDLKKGQNPTELKRKLAFEIVKQLHGEKEAKKALNLSFLTVHVFDNVHLSEEIKNIDLPIAANISSTTISQAVFDSGMAGTMSAAKNLVRQGGVSIIRVGKEKSEAKILKNPSDPFPSGETIIRVGKKKLIKVKK